MCRRILIQVAVFAASLAAGPAGACYFHGSLQGGFSSAFPGTVSIAVATRSAVDQGILEALSADPRARASALYRIRLAAGRHVVNMAAVKAPGPPVSVLLTQSHTWIRLNDPVHGAVFHSNPPEADGTVIMLPDRAFEGLLEGTYSVSEVEKYGIMRIHGDHQEHARDLWMRALGNQNLTGRNG